MNIPIEQQLACAKRELEMRKRVYPKWVKDERMTQAKAEHEIAAMEAIIETIERRLWCEQASEEMRGGE